MNTNQEIVEDTPEYRSVMIRAPLSAPPPPRSFARAAKLPSPSQRAPAVHVTPSVWQVSNLPALPAHYMLERSNVYVEGAPQSIADRVCETLRLESISAKVGEDDENLLLAETRDFLRFAVRLFADNGMTVVEVQRLQGCSCEFRETARSVLRSAKGVKVPVMPKRKFNLPSGLPVPSMEDKQKRVEDGVQIAMNMIQSERLDSQLLGLQSLEQLTICGDGKAVASKKTLSGDCAAKLLSMLDETEPRLENHFIQIRSKALGCLANSLTTAAESGDIVSAAPSELKSESFMSILVAAMDESTERPHEATQAARCIHSLIKCPECHSLIAGFDMDSTVDLACSVGSGRNALLEEEAKRLRTSLQRRI